MMRRFISLSLSAAIAIFAVAAGVSEASQSIVNVAADTPELTTLVEAVIRADLVDALSDAEDAYTVFAPINAGFDTLLQDLGVESLDAIDVDTLTDVLQYHILPGAFSAEDLTDATVAGLEALNGEMLSFSESFDGSTTSVQGLGSRGLVTPAIIQADIPAGNSIVHLVDNVLLPFTIPNVAGRGDSDGDGVKIPTYVYDFAPQSELPGPAEDLSIADVVSSYPDLSILVEAVARAGLLGAISDAESNLTLFAPVDDGFIGLFDDLGVASVSDIDVDTLADVLLNHLVEGARFESDILSGPNSEQALGGGTLRFEVEHLYDEVNIEVESLGASGPAAAEFIKPDIVAGNSVIHIVTNPLFHEAVPGARGRKGTN